MKIIDTKSLLLGILATSLVLILTSGKTIENDNNIDFVPCPTGTAIYNKTTKTLFLYGATFGGGVQEKPNRIYKVAEDGSSLTKNN